MTHPEPTVGGTSFDVWFPASKHGQEVLNIESFGAKRDFSADATAAIQACFDAAYGTKEAPNGETGRRGNKWIYVPPGDYDIRGPLYITGATGARIFGDSPISTRFRLTNPLGGNAWRGASSRRPDGGESPRSYSISPLLCMNGCRDCVIEGISFSSNSQAAGSVGLDIFQTGDKGVSTAPLISRCSFGNFEYGVLVGAFDPTGGNSENGILFFCDLNNCDVAGIQLCHQNVLNWNVYGGGAWNNAAGSTYNPGVSMGNNGAAYSSHTGAFSTISGVSLAQNGWDFNGGQSQPLSIISGSSESKKSVACVTSPIFISSFSYRPLGTTDMVFLSCAFGGMIHASMCNYQPPGDGVSEHPQAGSYIADMGVNGTVMIDGMNMGPNTEHCTFKGSGIQANLYMRATRNFPGIGQNMFADFTGQVREFEPHLDTTVTAFPAHARFAGRTRVITDLTSNTAGANAAGGGTLKGWCWCDGTNWKVIGPVT